MKGMNQTDLDALQTSFTRLFFLSQLWVEECKMGVNCDSNDGLRTISQPSFSDLTRVQTCRLLGSTADLLGQISRDGMGLLRST